LLSVTAEFCFIFTVRLQYAAYGLAMAFPSVCQRVHCDKTKQVAIFNHCDVFRQQSNRIGRKNAK